MNRKLKFMIDFGSIIKKNQKSWDSQIDYFQCSKKLTNLKIKNCLTIF